MCYCCLNNKNNHYIINHLPPLDFYYCTVRHRNTPVARAVLEGHPIEAAVELKKQFEELTECLVTEISRMMVTIQNRILLNTFSTQAPKTI